MAHPPDGKQDDRRISVSWPKRTDSPTITPLAFAINSGLRKITHRVTVVTWSEAAYAHLRTLGTYFRENKQWLPTRALRAWIEIADPRSLRLDSALGLGSPARVMLWTQQAPQDARTISSTIVLRWLVNDVARLVTSDNDAAMTILERLKDLARTQTVTEAIVRETNPYLWGVTQSKTAKATTPSSYVDLADYVARQIEGHSIFPDASAMRRIAGGSLDSGYAELMTEPITVGQGSQFSLVLRIRILTFPGRPMPIIDVQCSRRVWVTSLKNRATATRITAYAFPPDSTRTFPFMLERKGNANGTSYQLGDDFAPIERHYFPGKSLTAEQILSHGKRMKECRLLVGLRHGSGVRSEVKSGVPDIDKILAFDALTALLSKKGLSPWTGLEIVDTMAPTRDLDQHWSRRDQDHAEHEKYMAWRAEAEETIRSCYNGQHHLIIAVQPDAQVVHDAQAAEGLLTEILGSSVVTTRIPIPTDVHGPRRILPHASGNNEARAEMRMAAWRPFIEAVRRREQELGRPVDGILVIARRWYPDNQHDDTVNKRAARIALAQALEKPVQYLLPCEEPPAEGSRGKPKPAEQPRKSFENRLIMAWLDLAYKSLGRIKPGKLIKKATELYQTQQSSFLAAHPDQILALGVIRRNESRFLKNERSFLPYAIELDVESGVCRASFAYEDVQSKQVTWSSMLPLPQALVALAKIGPVQLYTNHKDYNYRTVLAERTQSFFKAQLAERTRRSSNPLVIVDTDSARSVWPWLKDEVIDPANVHLAGGYNEQMAWRHARMVRVRTMNSPKVLRDGTRTAEVSETREVLQMRSPKWLQATLLRLNDTRGSNVYLSFGSDIRQRKLEQSCYRSTEGFERKNIDGKPVYVVATVKPLTDSWTTPNGLEVVVLRPDKDSPNQLAQLIVWLRQCYAHFGAWTTKPAPLFFEGVLKEYLADFELNDDEGADGGEGGGDNHSEEGAG